VIQNTENNVAGAPYSIRTPDFTYGLLWVFGLFLLLAEWCIFYL